MDENQQPGGSPPDSSGGGGSSSSSSVTYSAANSITSASSSSDQTYTSETADENALLVSLESGTATLTNPTVEKSGDSDGGDNCNFYGINSAVMAMGGGNVSIVGGTVTAEAKGANGVFSYGGNGGTNGAAGDGTTVYIEGTTINTTGDNGGGIMTTGGGNTVARNLTITTTGQSSAPIRTDRGGGNVTVSGGSYESSGLGSPAIYSTADIVVENATLTSNLSEGVCIEGQNSVALTDCTLTANNTQTNGQATFKDTIMIYQSQSGDAADGTSTFSMTGGVLNSQSGHVFHVTNTTAIINLNNVTINDSGDGVILSVCDDGWSGASNVATLNASGQTLSGDILVGDDSTLTLNISDSSTFTGNVSGTINNASGSSVSTEIGTVNVNLDETSKWYLTGDAYVSSFSGTAANVITGEYTLYENGVAVEGTSETDDTTSDDAADDSSDDTADDSVDDTADDSSDDAADDSSDDTADDSVDDTADDSVDDAADDTSDDTADDSVDDAADDTSDDTADDSVDDTADDSVDDAADDSVDDAADDTSDDTADDSVDDAADDTSDDTADDSSDDAADDTSDDTADDSVDDAADDTSDDTADDSSDDTADDSVDDTADDTSDDAADDTSDDAADDSSDDAADDTSDDAADDSSDDAADDSSDDAADDTSDDAADDSSDDAADDTSDDAADDSSDDAADDTSDDTADDSSDDAADDTSDDTADDSVDDAADDSSDDAADDTSDDTADDSSDDAADDTSDDAADDTSDDTADDSSDDTADDTSDDAADDSSDITVTDVENLLKTEAQTVTGDTYKVDNDDGKNLVYVDSSAKGSKTITLGNGGDVVFVEASRGAKVTVTGGTGADILYAFGTAPTTFDMSKGGADKIGSHFDGENVTLKGYKASLGGGIATGDENTQEIVSEIVNDRNIIFGDGEIKVKNDSGTSGKYTFADNTNATGSVIFNMFDETRKKQAIGFTNSDGGKLDVSKESDNYLLVGNYFNDKNGGSTLIGGKGNDTLLGGEGDVLNAGGGNENLIILQNDDNRAGSDVILNSGKTTVQNFKAGFDDDSDRVFFGVNDVIDFKFDGTNVSVQTNDVWHGVLADVGDGADFANILAADANAPFKVAIAQENAVIAVEDEIADYYVGENSAVDFTGYDGSLMANIASEATSIGAGEILFSGINQLTAGSGQTTLMGSSRNETLYAGTGTASIYGGGGKNLLANTAEERDGATTFLVLGNADGARNTISGFAFVTADGVADKIEIDTNTNVVSGVRISGNDVIIEVSNRKGTATERAVIQGAVGQNIQFGNNVVAQVNTTALTYDGTANFFVATEKNAAISVGADVSGKAAIWLGNENFVGDIRTIDATASSVKAELAGNDADNIISAGSGDTSLWGGNGGDDFMQGGAGKNSFFYTNGNGSDTIGGVNEGDLVYLSEITLDQIASTAVENNVATINFKDGGKLTINDASNASYILTQGDQAQIYKVNESGFVNA